MLFESFANSERYKTTPSVPLDVKAFESFANSERYKTMHKLTTQYGEFESFANSERYKTHCHIKPPPNCLRALLIQKDTKLSQGFDTRRICLRALLIQKDTKLKISEITPHDV